MAKGSFQMSVDCKDLKQAESQAALIWYLHQNFKVALAPELARNLLIFFFFSMAKKRIGSKCGIHFVFTQGSAGQHSLQELPPLFPGIDMMPRACTPAALPCVPRSWRLWLITTWGLACALIFLLASMLLESRALSYSSNPRPQSQ